MSEKRMLARLLGPMVAGLTILLSTMCLAQEARPANPAMTTTPPTDYFAKAATSWAGGARDDATFWLYVAQLRFRARLAAGLSPDPRGEPALYAALMETVGRPINEYAFGDVAEACRQMDRALRWDDENPDASIPETVRRITRAGLTKLRDDMLRNADGIRRERTANGLMNR